MIINGVEYTTGIDRAAENGKKVVAHLYRGPFHNPGYPMCKKGYTCPPDKYSIFRNMPGQKICKVCMRRAKENKEPVVITLKKE